MCQLPPMATYEKLVIIYSSDQSVLFLFRYCIRFSTVKFTFIVATIMKLLFISYVFILDQKQATFSYSQLRHTLVPSRLPFSRISNLISID